jgi:hypothetical protein
MRRAEPFLIAAAAAAGRLGHGYVGTEHMLLALVEAGEVRGVSAAQIEADVVALGGKALGTRQELDADALATLGINLEEVRRHVERTFGAGALERAAHGCVPIDPRLKVTLARAVARVGDGPVGAEDVLEALRSVDCLGARILADRSEGSNYE